MRKLTLVLALAIVVAFAGTAYAEVQNVKVSGDIAVYSTIAWYGGLYHETASMAARSPEDQFWMSNIGINVDADLTENVGAHIRLVNELPWGLDMADADAPTRVMAGIGEAYISLREMLYEPLTLTIGRQPLFYGRGFVVGSNVNDPQNAVDIYDQYCMYDAFDSVKAQLDLDPWSIDAAYSVIKEDDNPFNGRTAITTWLVDIGYVFDEYNAEVELYYVGLLDRNRNTVLITTTNLDPLSTVQGVMATFVQERLQPYQTNTVGVRGSMEPIDNLLVFAEGAYQFGRLGDADVVKTNMAFFDQIIGQIDRKVSAGAAEVGAEYLWADVICEPKIGVQYSFRQGENFDGDGYAVGSYNAFYTPFMRRSDMAIYGHNGRYGIRNVVPPTGGLGGNAMNPAGLYYKTGDFANTIDDSDTGWDTNMHAPIAALSLKPLAAMDIDDVNLGLKYAWYGFNQSPMGARKKDAGSEVNGLLTYDYTEDVQFHLLFGYFWRGSYYKHNELIGVAGADASDAMLLEGAVKLTF